MGSLSGPMATASSLPQTGTGLVWGKAAHGYPLSAQTTSKRSHTSSDYREREV